MTDLANAVGTAMCISLQGVHYHVVSPGMLGEIVLARRESKHGMRDLLLEAMKGKGLRLAFDGVRVDTVIAPHIASYQGRMSCMTDEGGRRNRPRACQ